MQYLSDGDVTFGKFGKLLNEFPGIGSATNSYKKKSFVYKFKCTPTPTHTHNDESELILETGEPIEYAFHCYWWSSILFVYVQSLTLVYVNDST